MNKLEGIDRLFSIINTRIKESPEKSYSAKLGSMGTPKITQKLGEETIETIVAALTKDRKEVVKESADLIYHLLVLWVHIGIKPEEVWKELSKREALSGLEEKASRTNN